MDGETELTTRSFECPDYDKWGIGSKNLCSNGCGLTISWSTFEIECLSLQARPSALYLICENSFLDLPKWWCFSVLERTKRATKYRFVNNVIGVGQCVHLTCAFAFRHRSAVARPRIHVSLRNTWQSLSSMKPGHLWHRTYTPNHTAVDLSFAAYRIIVGNWSISLYTRWYSLAGKQIALAY